MKNIVTSVIIGFVSCCCTSKIDKNANDILWYDKPANIWEEYLPLGNGRLGLMTQGAIIDEHILLNEISMWSGSEYDYSNPKAAEYLPQIRQLLFEGKNVEAQNLMYKTFVPKATSCATYGSYQMLADLHIVSDFDTTQSVSNYRRELDMKNGVASTEFVIGSNHIKREYFVSRNADVIVVKLQSSEPTDITLSLSRPERTKIVKNGLVGELDSGQDEVSGVKYKVVFGSKMQGGGSANVDSAQMNLKQTTNAVVIVSAATSYLFADNYNNYADSLLETLLSADYEQLLAEHKRVHSSLYNRVKIDIAGCGDTLLTTDKRISNYATTADPAMAVLYYNFGRYSLISSTRKGSLPPNLQGLWANGISTPWNGDYHTNINVQMNHWPLEQGNLSELYEPLICLVENSVASGEKTAKDFYGHDARGWVMHMMTNVWQFTAPGEHPSWGATNTGGAWLCEHLWEHYTYTLDTAYLERIYPIMYGAAEFFESTMVYEPKHQWLVTAPTSSPENEFYTNNSSEPVSICMGPTMDVEIIRELYSNLISATEILGKKDLFIDKLKNDIKQLPPFQVSSEGYLQEWLEDYKEVDIHHRHVSHLYGLHPSNQISPIETPDLAEACKVTLNRRGDEATGWSRAWKLNFWARLFDGNRAEKLLQSLLATAVDSTGKHRSGTFPNLWCSHPPFQLDGNYGGAAGIGEMLLQSQMGYISPLPALPARWKSGSVKGMKVRGGAEVGMQWNNCRLSEMTIEGGKAQSYKIVFPAYVKQATIQYDNHKKQSLEMLQHCGLPSAEITMNSEVVKIVIE